MSTPAAIGLYTSTGMPPDRVQTRPWKGVYHHYDGDPGSLGNDLLAELRRAAGDLDVYVARVLTGAPHGWRSLGQPCSELDGTEPLTESDVGRVAFCYVLDQGARRLDAFATHAQAHGERIASVFIDSRGATTPRFLDLDPEETRPDAATDPRPPGPAADRATVQRLFQAHLPLRAGSYVVDAPTFPEDATGQLLASFQVFAYGANGQIEDIAQVEGCLASSDSDRDPVRIETFVKAWAEVLATVLPRSTDSAASVGRALLNPSLLTRCTTRDPARMRALLKSPRYLGGLAPGAATS